MFYCKVISAYFAAKWFWLDLLHSDFSLYYSLDISADSLKIKTINQMLRKFSQNRISSLNSSWWYNFFFFLCMQWTDEFLQGQNIQAAPETFHMGSLLQEMRQIEEAELFHEPQTGKHKWVVGKVLPYHWIYTGCYKKC